MVFKKKKVVREVGCVYVCVCVGVGVWVCVLGEGGSLRLGVQGIEMTDG